MATNSARRFLPPALLLLFVFAGPLAANDADSQRDVSNRDAPNRDAQETTGQRDGNRDVRPDQNGRRDGENDRYERFRQFRDRMSDDRRPPMMRGEGPGDFRGPMQNPLFMALDRNGDGRIDARELDLAIASLRTLDKNNDGEITREEAMMGGASMGGERGGFIGRGRRGEDSPPNPGPPGNRMGDRAVFPSGDRPPMEEMFSRMDRDGDGMLSKEEAPERIAEYFDRADQDGDGKLSKPELQTAFQRMMSMGRGDQGRRAGSPEEPAGGTRPRRPESE